MFWKLNTICKLHYLIVNCSKKLDLFANLSVKRSSFFRSISHQKLNFFQSFTSRASTTTIGWQCLALHRSCCLKFAKVRCHSRYRLKKQKYGFSYHKLERYKSTANLEKYFLLKKVNYGTRPLKGCCMEVPPVIIFLWTLGLLTPKGTAKYYNKPSKSAVIHKRLKNTWL